MLQRCLANAMVDSGLWFGRAAQKQGNARVYHLMNRLGILLIRSSNKVRWFLRKR